MDAEIISVGDELLYGDIIDTNKPYLAHELRVRGIRARYFQTVGDEREDITGAFKLAMSRSHIILVTGGLGPTEDDLTAASLADALGVSMAFNEHALAQIANRLRCAPDQVSQSNQKQAFIPEGADILRNDAGTAPGIHFNTGDNRSFFLMPGVPREMKGIFHLHIGEIIQTRYPSDGVIAVKHIHLFGLPESEIGTRIAEMMVAGRNPDVGTRAKYGTISIRIVARGSSVAEAETLLETDVIEVRKRFGDVIVGEDDDSLQRVVGNLLIAKSLTIALAESCTAGRVSALLGEVPGISHSLLEGAVVYSNEAKMRTCGVRSETLETAGAVSEETARELADGIRKRASSDLGVGVTGIAGPGGGTEEKPVGLVYIAITTAEGTRVTRRQFHQYDRETFGFITASTVLDVIRKTIIESVFE